MRRMIFVALLCALSYAQTGIFERVHFDERKLKESILKQKNLVGKNFPKVKPFKAANRKPVIFVAAMTGSKIMGKLDYPSSHVKPGPFCYRKADWYLLYAGTDVNDPDVPSTLLPTNYMCTLDNLKVNLTTKPAKNVDGVQTMLIGETVEVTGNSSSLIGWDYVAYKHMTVGYEWDVDMFAHPYDFRFGAVEYSLKEWPKLKANVERAYSSNGKTKVVLQSLSMGGTYVSGFLQTMNQDWKDTYIDSWISLAGSLNGSTYNIGSAINGENYEIFYVDKQKFADMYSTWPSSIWVTPVADDVDGVIAITPSFNYTITEIPQLMYKAGLFDVGDLKRTTYNKNSWNTAKDPGVKTWCWYSYNVPTVTVIRWKDDSLSDDSRDDIKGGGDGVVHYHGLRVCDQWKNTEQWIYEDVPHAAEVGTDWVLDRLIKIVSGVQKCAKLGDEYTTDCGAECNDGDLEIGQQGCGFFNTREAKNCLKVITWNCDYYCGAEAYMCAEVYDGKLVAKNGGCNQGMVEDQPFYDECKSLAESSGVPFYTYHGDAYPYGCYQGAGDATIGYNFKDVSISNCTGRGNSILPVQTCYCRDI